MSKTKYPTAPAPFDTRKPKIVRSLPFKKMAVAVSLFLGVLPGAQAQLPAPVESALNRAKISSEDISLIIMPVDAATNGNTQSTPKKSRLPKTVKPTEVEALESESSDPDALPPETSNSIVKPVVASTESKPSAQQSDTATTKPTNPTVNETANQTVATNTGVTGSVVSETSASSLEFPVRHLTDLPRTPASTMKLIPTFVALDLLGPDFVWFTQVYHTGFVSANTPWRFDYQRQWGS